ncbi:MAG: [protein-PII] uridylyltransferase [Betaproteobacteria bacterium]|nr:[protein-PII] uridylyltransferase [Betaproteobacteria bacterium]
MGAPGPGIPRHDAVRAALSSGRARLREQFLAHPNPRRLLRGHTRLIDASLKTLWRESGVTGEAALVAVGGYARREQFPSSDIDVLVLLRDEPSGDARDRLESFVRRLWDAGLEIGHSVRTIEACREEARVDVTVQTTLLESRLLSGSRRLFDRLRAAIAEQLDMPSFFEAKRLEQEQRHAKLQDTAFSLEPNLKEAPGGLRDLHTIKWIAGALGIGASWRELERAGLITPAEARQLARDEALLQVMRIRLHFLAGRREDRIVFDYQTALAGQMGFSGNAVRRAGEQLMQRYYRSAKEVTLLNTILLQNLAARIGASAAVEPRMLNERFEVRGELLSASSEDLFLRSPGTILESFLLMQQHQELRGMTATTLRALWRARSCINADFRRDPCNRMLFLHILQQPRGVVHEFRRMNQYGILGRYLPEFGRIVGQMQHDLFHVYTVDQHILMVLRNLRRFAMPELAHEFPLATQLMSGFSRRWLLYVAALYHDLAKGRGADHSELGATDAGRFCRSHGLAREDTELVQFLVTHHLTLSSVAQKQDTADPEVVRAFAAKVVDERRLIALYLLTVADVRGTSPKVWNAWKAKLLEDLFHATRRLITGGRYEMDTALAETQAEALRLLRLYALSDSVKDRFWAELDTTYFLRHDSQEIAWQTRTLHYRVDSIEPVVKARLAPFGEGLQVMIYTPDRAELFARICGYFERANFNIVEAKIHTTRHRHALDTFLVMGSGDGTHYRDMIALVESGLAEELRSTAPLRAPRRGRVSRRVRHFPVTPMVDLRPDERGISHVLTLVASDRPGLLYGVARILAAHRIDLRTAKINTLGDRGEDVFLVSGDSLRDEKSVLQLEQELLAELQVS